MRELFGQRQGFAASCRCEFELALLPQDEAGDRAAAHAGIVTRVSIGQRMMATGIVPLDRAIRMLTRHGAVAHEEVVRPEHVMSLDRDSLVLCVPGDLDAAPTQILR